MGVQDRLAMHLRHSGGKRIVVAREESVANNVISTSSSNNGVYSSGGSYKLLAEMGNCWKEHRITMGIWYSISIGGGPCFGIVVVSEGGLGMEEDIESSWMDVNGDTKNEGGGITQWGRGGAAVAFTGIRGILPRPAGHSSRSTR